MADMNKPAQDSPTAQPAPEGAQITPLPTPLACTFDPATGDDCGYISIWRNDDQPDASLIGRLTDILRNREIAAFIVTACNQHAALTASNAELRRALELTVDPLQFALDRAEWQETHMPKGTYLSALSPDLRFALQVARAALGKEAK